MKKNTGKVLSLVLAMAMAASTFTATFASAATLEVEGNTAEVSWQGTDGDLVSDKYTDLLLNSDLDNMFTVQSEDHEDVDDIEYVGFTKVSGDSLVRVVRDTDDDTHDLYLRKGVSGTETIRFSVRGTYVDEDTDRDVTVRGTVDVSFTVYTQGDVKIGMNDGDNLTSHPSDPELAAVNDSGVELALYYADHAAGTATPDWSMVQPFDNGYDASNSSEDGYLRLSSGKIFNISSADADIAANHVKAERGEGHVQVNSGEIILPLIRDDKDSGRWYADPATTTLELYAPKINVTEDSSGEGKVEPENATKGERLRVTVGVARAWALGVSNNDEGDYSGTDDVVEQSDAGWSQIARIGSRTVIGSNPSSDDKWSEVKGTVKVISNYEVRMTSAANTLFVESGTLGAITGDCGTVTVEDGNIDSIDVDTATVSNATVGAVTANDTATVEMEASVASISAGVVNLQGASVSGDVSGATINITGDADVATKVGGDVTVDADDGTLNVLGSEDEEVSVGGYLVVTADGVEVSVEGLGVTIGGIHSDFWETEFTFTDFDGAIDVVSTDTAHSLLAIENDSNVTINNDTYLGSVTVDETSTLTFNGTIKLDDLNGDGTVQVNPDSLFVKSGLDGVQIRLLGNPAVGDVVMRSTVDTVAAEDINGIGFTAAVTNESSTVDRFTIDAVEFAGIAFAEPNVELSVGTTDTLQVVAYPSGTQIPSDLYLDWGDFDGDEDYIEVTDPTSTGSATVTAKAYNDEYARSNRAVLTVRLVDADGFEAEGYVPAVCNISVTNAPASTVTLDTTTVTRQVGQIYQFIASSTAGGTITAASSDANVATVALYDANDARGHKFQINAVGVGTATITATDVNGATASLTITVTESTGSLKMDTTAYTMAPGGIYDILVTVEGADVEPEVTISRDAIASLTALGEGKYRVTARNEGTTYVTATVTVNGVEYHTSVQINVVAGATASGVTGNNVTYFA